MGGSIHDGSWLLTTTQQLQPRMLTQPTIFSTLKFYYNCIKNLFVIIKPWNIQIKN
jgi:hypothetical protein